MPEQVTNYKCPACTGPLQFDSATGKQHCEYCGSSYSVAEIEAMYAAKNAAAEQAGAQAAEARESSAQEQGDSVDGWQLSGAGEEWGADAAGMRAYNCPSCGAELICDDTTAATSCPYCDNPTIIPTSLAGSLKPELIIPFKLDKQQAKDAFRSHLKGKKLLPKLFSQENHLDEIKGVYVPFWLYDADANASITYAAQRINAWSDSEYDYTETQVFDLHRSGGVGFKDVPVDGSKKMDDTLMEAIEPYDASQTVEFKTAYLAGYLADRYDVPAGDCIPRANERMQKSVKDCFISTTGGFTGVQPKSSRIHISKGRARYALFPVWILNTTWHDKKYVFAMNGQTGKFVGDLPADRSLKLKWQLIYGGVFAVLLYVLEWLLLA